MALSHRNKQQLDYLIQTTLRFTGADISAAYGGGNTTKAMDRLRGVTVNLSEAVTGSDKDAVLIAIDDYEGALHGLVVLSSSRSFMQAFANSSQASSQEIEGMLTVLDDCRIELGDEGNSVEEIEGEQLTSEDSDTRVSKGSWNNLLWMLEGAAFVVIIGTALLFIANTL